MDAKAEVLLDGLAFPEGPRWHEGRLWFSDMHDHRVRTLDLRGRSEVVVEVPNAPSGLGWLPDGRLLVVSMEDRRVLRQGPQGLVLHADLSRLASYHCNDMVTDARGRSYVGNFGFDLHAQAPHKDAEIVLVEPDGRARVVAREMRFPNGTVMTPDGRTLIVGESAAARLTAFDVQDDGSLANRRVWAQLERAVPDGICLDAEGCVWVASPLGQEMLRVERGGRVTDRVQVSRRAIACMLGGPDRKTLFCATSDTFEPEACRAARRGAIEVARVDVAGAGFP
ncbi:MAG TPA: SMP-30/gluconolactonase/LRE family protein [Myxococcota bacterium]|nr:SMP-30/gluconolactonase/LRE family protein [Myxococcota bacterium]